MIIMTEEERNKLKPEWSDYSELTLNGIKKWDLIKYIKRLEEIISTYDDLLIREFKLKEEAITYIENHTYNERTKNHNYDLMNREVKELLHILKNNDLSNIANKDRLNWNTLQKFVLTQYNYFTNCDDINQDIISCYKIIIDKMEELEKNDSN